MHFILKNFILYLIFLFGFSSLSFSQDNPVKFLDISDGLSNNSVTTIFQDSEGYLWFGTYDGLNRYDGYSFKVFRNRINDKKSLSFNTIYNIEGDSQKNIWIGGSNGISIYNKSKAIFHPVEYFLPNQKMPKILTDIIHQTDAVSKNLVLVASQKLGLIAFENNSFVGQLVPLKVLDNNIEMDHYDAVAIMNDKKNNHSWVFVRNVGICSYSYKSKTMKVLFPLSIEVKAMKLATDGNLWLGTDEGVFLLDTKSGSLSNNYFANNCSVTDLLIDKNKEIWATDYFQFLRPANYPL